MSDGVIQGSEFLILLPCDAVVIYLFEQCPQLFEVAWFYGASPFVDRAARYLEMGLDWHDAATKSLRCVLVLDALP